MVLHLGGVATLDSSGIGELVSSYSRAQQRDGRLKLAPVSEKVRMLLMITRLISVFEVFDTEDEAVKSFA
jgi:anti-sigma B factor antagonist